MTETSPEKIAALAERYGVPESQVRQFYAEHLSGKAPAQWARENIPNIIRLFTEGTTLTMIAALYGVERKTIHRILKEHAPYLLSAALTPREDIDTTMVLTLFDQGLTVKELAIRYGTTPGTIKRRLLPEREIELRQRRWQKGRSWKPRPRVARSPRKRVRQPDTKAARWAESIRLNTATLVSISESEGLSIIYVRKRVRSAAPDLVLPNSRKRTFSRRGVSITRREAIEVAQKLYEEGQTRAQISKELDDTSEGTISAWLPRKLTRLSRRQIMEVARIYSEELKDLDQLAIEYKVTPKSLRNLIKKIHPDFQFRRKRKINFDKVVKFYDEGLSITDISNLLDCDYSYVYRIIRSNAPGLLKGAGKPRSFDYDAAISRFEQGDISIASLASQLGISNSSLSKVLRKHAPHLFER